MTKTAKIITTASICVVCVLAIVLGCLFGIKCTITFDYGFPVNYENYSSGDLRTLHISEEGQYPKTTTVVRYSKYSAPRISRNGYTFDGWYTDSACTIPWNNTAVNSDMTLYAKWKAV